MKMWRDLPAAVAVASLLIACSPTPPDVILITLDTTRADHLGAYDYAKDTSPTLDALAAEGIRFARAWSTSPWTLPAHASMLTGKYPTRHGAHFSRGEEEAAVDLVLQGRRFFVYRLGEREVTLAELLADRGYATAAFVAGPWLAPPFGLLQGYETHEAAADDYVGKAASEITDGAVKWLADVDRDRPIHLLLNYFDAHDPYRPPAAYAADEAPGATQLERQLARYDGEIRYMDAEIGRFLDALEREGRYEDALIVAVSDHGELFGEHGLVNHGYYLYEELIRVALIVRLPGGRRAGEVVESPVSIVDLLPLIGGPIGLALPEDIDGLPVGRRELVLAESFRNPTMDTVRGRSVDRDLSAMIRWPWKLIVSSDGDRQLYRLDLDPTESHDARGASVERQLIEQWEAVRAAIAPAGPGVQPRDVTPEMTERLRDLGYLD